MPDLKDILDDLITYFKNIDMKKVSVVGVLVIMFGLLLLSFTFIVPILIFAAALGIIGFIVYLVYKFLGGS